MSVPLAVRLQHLLPKNLVSAVTGRIARSRTRWLKSGLIRWFAGHYGVDMREADPERLEDYETFNAFFTRALKAGARRVDDAEHAVVSPADGYLTEFGTLEQGRLLQAKGLSYGLEELLGEPRAPEALASGSFATVYLAPHHYHRVHAPLAGRLVQTRYVPGERFSVNRTTASVIDRLFCRNERAVLRLDTRFGPAFVVLVGALNVSSISTAALGLLESGRAREWRHDPPVEVAKGDEIGRFNLGSTVVVVLPALPFAFEPGLENGTPLTMGRALGRFVADR